MLEKKSERKLLRPSWYTLYFHFFNTENALPLSKNVTSKGKREDGGHRRNGEWEKGVV